MARNKLLMVLTATTCLTATTGSAFAQTSAPAAANAPASADQLTPTQAVRETAPTDPVPQAADAANGDVVVTAQQREQRLQVVPIAVSVTSGQTLVRQNLVTLESVATGLPAIRIARNTNSDTIAVRGIGSGQNAGFEQAVGTFVDGVYRGRSRSSRAALFDAERVEVLKGPQTTFFGNNTVAGAINITTRKPSQQFGVEARTLYTSETGEYSEDFAVTGPITDTLSFRAAGQAYGMNGYVHNVYSNSDGPRLRDLPGACRSAGSPWRSSAATCGSTSSFA